MIVAPSPHRRKRRWPRVLLWSACGLLAFILLAAGAGVLWLRLAAKAALPVLDGDLHLAGLSAPVIVRRDAHGVPHIEAATQDDLFIAQGYVTAQDRLWQMDALRRSAKGELSEIMGSSTLSHDRAQRVLQFRITAQRIYANLPLADRTRFDDYARGVNLFIAQHPDSLPPEFKLLGYRPQPWTGVDSVSIGLSMVEMLDSHWDTKLARETVSAKLGNPELEKDLYPIGSWRDHPPTGLLANPAKHAKPTSTGKDDDDDRSHASAAGPTGNTQTKQMMGAPSFSRSLRKGWEASNLNQFPVLISHEDTRALSALLGKPACDGCAPGSNNWVISGKHTASGQPLLSNDMHLALTEPNIWFMADLIAPGYHAAGVTLPGMPYVIAGHNEHVAWGFTALYADVQDFYIEATRCQGTLSRHRRGLETSHC